MRFKSDDQRKAVMAKLKGGKSVSSIHPSIISLNNSQLRKRGVKLVPNKDIDRDGVKNKDDCAPLNPKKQGFLHDLAIKRLKRKEEKLERIREKELRKLEDVKDVLKERQAVGVKKASISQLRNKQKQAIISEITEEKRKTHVLKKANEVAKKQLDKLTITGKAKSLSKKAAKQGFEYTRKGVGIAAHKSKQALQATNAFLNKESTRRTIRNTVKGIANLFLDKKDMLKIEKKPKRGK